MEFFKVKNHIGTTIWVELGQNLEFGITYFKKQYRIFGIQLLDEINNSSYFLKETRMIRLWWIGIAFSYSEPPAPAIQPPSPPSPNPTEADFSNYLSGLTVPYGEYSDIHIAKVRWIWKKVREVNQRLPAVILMQDGGIQLAWINRSHKYISIDIYENSWEWFFRDRLTDKYGGGSGEEGLGVGLPAGLLNCFLS